MDLKKICEGASEIICRTGEFIRKERNLLSADKVEVKGTHNFVTYVDKEAEAQLIIGLNRLFPKAGFIAEEGTRVPGKDVFKWVIDPLDGTTNYIHGAPPYSISVALMENDNVILGIVLEIFSSELFYSYLGAPAFLNGHEIHVSANAELSGALIATGFPYNNFDRMTPFMKSLDYFFLNSAGVRRLGSAAVDLAYVACGRYDAFYEYNLNPWDVAAGAFLVNQAGGNTSDFSGGNGYIFGKEIAAANNLVFEDFLQKVGQFMNV
jgi:myo-inositol-1(or 4)-monophosphatase